MLSKVRRSTARSWWCVLAALMLVALGSGCASQAAPPAPEPPVAQVSLEPGGTEVAPTAPVRATVAHGTLGDLSLTNPDGKQVRGEFSEDRASWSASEALGYGKTYTWSGTAVGEDGKDVPVRGEFTTVRPDRTVRATVNPTDGDEVGIAMPISVKFDSPVEDRAAAQGALKVHTSEPVEGAWAWLSDTQVDWRPKEYWPSHTDVTVSADLYGVHYGGGEYGKADLTSEFSVGRGQVVKADVTTHQMIVEREGARIASYPASYGKESDPNLNTPNGTYIVMQKNLVEIMDNPRYGYTDVEKKWAVRMSNHGEFIHENEENRANLGKANTSHGCVNLGEADAHDYFKSALVGDPVEVTGSASTMPPRYDVFDWMVDWDEWVTKSAL